MSKENVMEILDKLEFFGGQRAGRELWAEKPKEIQDKDIEDFCRDLQIVRSALNDAEPVKHSRWKTVPYRAVEHGNVVISGEVEMCTNCRCARKEFHKQMNYCPNCGAKMDEEVQ